MKVLNEICVLELLLVVKLLEIRTVISAGQPHIKSVIIERNENGKF